MGAGRPAPRTRGAKALDAERTLLHAELDELRARLAARQRLYRSRKAAIKRGEQLTRAEFNGLVPAAHCGRASS